MRRPTVRADPEGMTYPCPICRTPATLDSGCPGCGAPPDPEAAEVVALNVEFDRQRAHVDTAYRDYLAAAERLEEIRLRRNRIAARVAARASASTAGTTARAKPAPQSPPPPAPPAAIPARPETSVRTVQNVLFVLGGLLLGSAAVVFTAVAWASFGVVGRAAILAVTTVVVLTVPPLALLRRLTATAETFAALGLLLVLLDGYAAWYVNLAGVATALPPTTYAGVAFAVTAALAWGYGAATGLIGPRHVALVAVQPVLPLLAARAGFGAAGWTVLCGLVALGDIAVAARPRRHGLAVAAWILAGLAGLTGAALALAGEISSGTVPAALRTGTALVFLAAIPLVHRITFRAGSAVLAAVVVGAFGRVVLAGWPSWTLPLLAAAVAVLALAARRLPGPRVALGAWTAALAVVAAGWSLLAGVRTVAAAFPAWHADLASTAVGTHVQLPLTVLLLAIAAVALLPAVLVEISAVAAVLLALAVPVPWWASSLVDGVAVLPLLVTAVLVRRASWWYGIAAGFLALHAVGASLARPYDTAAVAGALVLIAGTVAALGRRGQRGVGAVATGGAVLLLPLACAAAAERLGAAVLGLVIATAATYRLWPDYRKAATVAVPLAGLGVTIAALVSFGPTTGPYTATVALCVLVAAGWWTAAVAAVPAVVIALPAVWSVLVTPQAEPPHGAFGFGPVAITLALLSFGARRAVPVPAGLAVLVGAAALGAPWPTLPGLSLALGLAGALVFALRRGTVAAAVLAALTVPAGLAGASSSRGTLLAALGATTVVAVVCAIAGRDTAIRAGAWVAAVGSAASVAMTAALTGDLTVRTAAFWMLVPAAAALGTAALLKRAESVAVEAAAHATAVVAALLTVGSIRHTAGVCTLWGLAIGLSALRRPVRVVPAAATELLALWLLLADRNVAVLEAYTVPAAAVALLGGWFVARWRPEAHSWVVYGPALLAAFGPSTATLLNGTGEPARRLALGAAALAVVLGGAVRRRQAPVVVGGAVLGAVAVHETVLLWDLVQRWILLGLAGLVLIGLAVTYERRRRDVTRLAAAVSRMR
jgi:hypothetical protein